MKIGNVEVGNMFLAPLAGVSDVGMRHLARKYGATLTYTEMVSAIALMHNSSATKDLLVTSPLEKPCAVQIFGSDPMIMANACKSKELEKFDIIDINMGCPAPKIVKNGEGSALMKDLELARQIIRACRKATNKPITVKMRKGFTSSEETCIELAKICEEEGASAITIHGRSTSQMYSGTVNYDIIKKVKQSVSIPVIGNGDIVDKQSYNKMLETGVDAVMIGRGALGKPWIFNEIKGEKTPENVFDACKLHADILKTYYSEKYLSFYLRKHFLWYTNGVKNASKARKEIAVMKSVDEGLNLLKNLFD